MTERQERPRFKRISIYNSPDRLLSFWYPPEWQLTECELPHRSVTLHPDPQDPATSLTVEVRDMQQSLTKEERPFITEGIKEGLNKLDDCVIERFHELDNIGSWGLEWICEFSFDGQRRRRRARLFYSGQYQYSVLCQGATVEAYQYWQGMFEFVMLTVGTANFSVAEWATAEYPEHLEGGDATGKE